MSISNLSVAEMLGLSSSWVDPARHRKTLQSSPRLGHFLVDLDGAHVGLLSLGEGAPAPSPELAALQATEATVDVVHDRKARGTSRLMKALLELADTDEQRQSVQAAASVLFPQGLLFVNTTYSAQVGNVAATERRLAAATEAQALLRKVKLPWGETLLDQTHAWFEAGHELGKLEARRSGLPAAPRPVVSLSKARGRWLSVVSAMLSALKLDDEPSADIGAHLLGPLAEAEARADARVSRRKSGQDGPAQPDPTDDPDQG